MAVGFSCIAASAWNVAMAPRSGHAWFDLCGMILLTFVCFDNFRTYQRRLKNGIKFGSRLPKES